MPIIYETTYRPTFLQKSAGLYPMAHAHKEIEMIFVRKGHTDAFVDGRHYPLTDGDLLIVFPNQVHSYQKSVQGEYIVTLNSPDIIFEMTDIFKKHIPKENVIHLSPNGYIAKYFANAVHVEGKLHNTILCGYFNLILGSVIPQLTLVSSAESKKSRAVIKGIMDYCNDNFMNDISLDDVAEHLHISKYHVSHTMNGQLGFSFNDYINSLRIQEACNQLKETDKKIADISEDVGFGTIRSFNRAFLAVTDTTPLKYRSLVKENEDS